METLYDAIKKFGINHGNHASDLYLPVTHMTTILVKLYGEKTSTFISNIDKKAWYEINFAYMPFWRENT